MVLLPDTTTAFDESNASTQNPRPASQSLPINTAAWTDCDTVTTRDLDTSAETAIKKLAADCGGTRDLLNQEDNDGGYVNYTVRRPSTSPTYTEPGNLRVHLSLRHI